MTDNVKADMAQVLGDRDMSIHTQRAMAKARTTRMPWRLSYRADPAALPLADRHYNRQKIGSPQFVPPGRCVVLLTVCGRALWVTSWPFAEYVKHAWPGSWVNSLFRSEGAGLASDLILQAVSVTRWRWPTVPDGGLVTFVDPKEVPPVMRRGVAIYGYCYLKAGFRHVGFTADGKWAWQLLPVDMPASQRPDSMQIEMFA